MKKLVAAVFAWVLLGMAWPARTADGITANAALKSATAEAKKWKPDAALTAVATSDAKQDGTSTHWTYSFASKSTKTCFRIVVLAAGNAVATDLGDCTLEPAIAETFVDSPAAVSAASAAGFKAGETISLVLSHKYDQNLTPSRECWSVSSPEHDFDSNKAVMRGWCVDPKTGKFVTRTAGQGGRNR